MHNFNQHVIHNRDSVIADVRAAGAKVVKEAEQRYVNMLKQFNASQPSSPIRRASINMGAAPEALRRSLNALSLEGTTTSKEHEVSAYQICKRPIHKI